MAKHIRPLETRVIPEVCSDGTLFSMAGDGHISVLGDGAALRVLVVNRHGSQHATPQMVDGILYVRTHGKLFAFGFAAR